MNVEVVIGANYGDEGKGLVTDYICKNNDNCIVVLNNGGCQRGHTVEHRDGRRHVFHHFGSGTLRGVRTYFTKDYYLNPMEFIREYEELKDTSEHLIMAYHDPKCIVQLPSDIALNWHLERLRASNDVRNGSCGCGIWETYQRIHCQHNALTFDKFVKLNYHAKIDYINMVAKQQRNRLNENIELFDIFMNQGFINHFISDTMEMDRLCKSVEFEELVKNRFQPITNIVIENGQGLMLDEHFSDDSAHSTPSKTGAYGTVDFLSNIGISCYHRIDLNYVSRTYLTRHGNGHLENEVVGKFPYVDKTNIPNEWQGSLRYGHLNASSLRSRIQKDKSMFVDSMKVGYEKLDINLFLTHANEEKSTLDSVYGNFGNMNTIYMSNTHYSEDIVKLVER